MTVSQVYSSVLTFAKEGHLPVMFLNNNEVENWSVDSDVIIYKADSHVKWLTKKHAKVLFKKNEGTRNKIPNIPSFMGTIFVVLRNKLKKCMQYNKCNKCHSIWYSDGVFMFYHLIMLWPVCTYSRTLVTKRGSRFCSHKAYVLHPTCVRSTQDSIANQMCLRCLTSKTQSFHLCTWHKHLNHSIDWTSRKIKLIVKILWCHKKKNPV